MLTETIFMIYVLPCDKFIRILIKNAQYDLYDSRSPSFWFHVASEITLVEDKIGPFID